MPPKKRKLLDLDQLEAEFTTSHQLISGLEELVEQCFSSGICLDALPENVLIAVTVLKYGFQFVKDIMLAFESVPGSCGPWQEEIIMQLVASMTKGNGNLNPQQILIIRSFMQLYLKRYTIKYPTAATTVFSRVLCNNVSPEVDQVHPPQCSVVAGCIAPPTNLCFVCGGNLHANNKPTMVTLYHVSGPLPFLKVELRCRTCQINYSITKHGNSMHGYRYYDHLGIIEASNSVYIDRLLMEIFVALR